MNQFINSVPVWAIILAALWTIPWKGVALWKAAQKKDVYWFIALLLINTIGILEILYIFVFSKMEWKKKK
jgi:hypothetical protein